MKLRTYLATYLATQLQLQLPNLRTSTYVATIVFVIPIYIRRNIFTDMRLLQYSHRYSFTYADDISACLGHGVNKRAEIYRAAVNLSQYVDFHGARINFVQQHIWFEGGRVRASSDWKLG